MRQDVVQRKSSASSCGRPGVAPLSCLLCALEVSIQTRISLISSVFLRSASIDLLKSTKKKQAEKATGSRPHRTMSGKDPLLRVCDGLDYLAYDLLIPRYSLTTPMVGG